MSDTEKRKRGRLKESGVRTDTTQAIGGTIGPAIPADINKLSRYQAAQYYVEKLGWAIQPLYGPNQGRGREQGKKAAHKGWKHHRLEDSTPEFIARYFGGKKEYNLGCTIGGDYVHVDLDSKESNGAAVMEWLADVPGLSAVPRERTNGGVHLVFRCRDLPASMLMAQAAPVSKISETVVAELFVPGLTIVLSPSVHPSGHRYRWEVTGEIPLVTWADLQGWFGFTTGETGDKRKKKDRTWTLDWKEDLRSLNLVAALEDLELVGECLDPDNHKWAVLCPWREHHSGTPDLTPTGGTVVFNPPDRLPAFKCLHAHCAGRSIRDLLVWIEQQRPGLISDQCSRLRKWETGQESGDGRPRVLLPGLGRPDSEFATEVGGLIGPRREWFQKSQRICSTAVRKVSEKSESLVFHPIQPIEAVTAAEQFVEFGILVKGEIEEEPEFTSKSMTTECAGKLIASPQFRRQLPEVLRIIDVPIPIATKDGIQFPDRGYDPRFLSFCPPDAPEPDPVSLPEARTILAELHREFCWKDPQSLTHAIARLITPYCRGLMGWDSRFPLWHYSANRPRAGKDYLAVIPHLIYEGRPCEDAPLDRDSEETRKRITAALMSGRRVMHFANCQGYIQDPHFIGAITSKTFAARNLGSTEAKADLVLPNEIEFSLSANVGVTYREDVEPRTRRIALEFFVENPNSRHFRRPDLHQWVIDERTRLLGAVAALVRHWIQVGCPPGPSTFNSFPEWARVVGGILTACRLGDPCLPHDCSDDIGGDRQERAMRAIFRIGYENHPDTWIEKGRLFELLEVSSDNEELVFFMTDHDISSKSSRVRIGKALRQFRGRHLDGIQLLIEDNAKSERQRLMFTQPSNPVPVDVDRLIRGEVGEVGDVHTLQKATSDNDHNTLSYDRGEVQGNKVDEPPPSPLPPQPHRERLLHTDAAEIATVVRDLGNEDRIALDIETYGPRPAGGLDPFRGEIRLIALAGRQGPVHLLDLQTIGYDALAGLRPLLEEKTIIAHNAKFDLLWLRVKAGINSRKVICTLTASRLHTAGIRVSNGLDYCLKRYLLIEPGKDLSRSDWGAMLLTPEQLEYAAADVAYLHDLAGVLEHELEINGLDQVWMLESGLLPCVVDMEHAGVAVDQAKLESIRDGQTAKATEAAESLRAALGTPTLNLDSPVQLLTALRAAGLDLKNTREEDLKRLSDNTLVPLLLGYREAIKRAQQAVSLLKHVAADGRIHSRFEPMGTATGRFSSKDPNLQNIGRGDLRSAFVAPPGHKFVIADYSQIELRAAAAIAGETKMIDAYKNGTDLHALTAASVLGIGITEVTKDQRQMSKAVNFGNLYGQGDEGLARYAMNSYGVEMTVDEAHRLRLKFFKTYPRIRGWHGMAWEMVNQHHEAAKTGIGRRRLIPHDASNWERFTALVNTPVQGGTADGMKYAIVLLSERLPEGARIVSTVHDELVVECQEADAESVRALTSDTMVEAMSDLFPQVPIEVEATIADTWAEK